MLKNLFNLEVVDSFPWGVINWKDDHSILYANVAARSIFNLIGDDKIVSLHDIAWVDQLGEPLSPGNHPIARCFENGEKVSGIVIGFSLPSETQITWIEAYCIPEFEEGNQKPVQVVFTFSQTAHPQTFKSNDADEDIKFVTIRDGKCIFESDVLNRIGQAVIVTDLQGKITYTNETASKLYGWTKDEFSTKNVLDTTVPDASFVLANGIMEKLTKGESWSGEFEVKRKDGTIFPAFVTDTPIYNEQKKLSGIIGISSDISEQKVQKEALLHSEMLLKETGKIAKVGGWELDCSTMQQVWTDETYVIHDREKGIYNPNSTEELSRFEPGSKELIEQAFETALTRGDPYDLELEMTTIKGNRKWVRAVCSPSVKEGKVTMLSGTVQDITELKRMEIEKHEKDILFQTLVEKSSEAITVVNQHGNAVYVSPTTVEMLGYSAPEFRSMRFSEILHPEDIPLIESIFAEVMQTPGKEVKLLGRQRHKTGHYLWCEGVATNWLNDPAIGGIVVNFRDITERKLTEEKLKESEERYRTLFSSMDQGFCIIEKIASTDDQPVDFRFVEANPAFERHSGISDVVGKTIRQLVPDTEQAIFEIYNDVIQTGKHHQFETYIASLDFWIEAEVVPAEKPNQVAALFSNITERKQAEMVLRESENRFSTLFKLNPSPVAITSAPDYRIVDVNEAWCRLTGYAREEVIGHTSTELALVEIGTLQQIREVLKEHNKISPFEITLHTRSGQERQVIMSSERIELCSEFFFINTLSDITELKLADRNKSIALAKYKALFDNFPMGITVSDKNGNIIETNATAEKLLGISAEEQKHRQLSGEEWQIIRTDGTPMPAEEYASVRALIEGHKVENVEMGIVTPDKSITWINVTAAPIQLEDYGVVVTYNNITERRQAEQKLSESEQKLKLFVEFAPAAIAMFDTEMKYIAASKRFLLDYGIQDSNIIGRSHYDVFPEISEEWKSVHHRCLAGATEINEDDIFPRADGSIDWVRWEIHPWHQNDEKIGGVILFSEVITERKQALDALQENERRLRKTIETTSDGFWIVDSGRRFIEVNDAYCKMSGYTRQELISMNISDIEAIEVTEDTNERIQKIIKDGSDRFETAHRRKDGSLFDVEVGVNVLDPEQGLMICFCRDITERKQGEKQLRESEKRFSTIFEDSPVAIAISRLNDGKIIMANSSIVELLGYTPAELIGYTTSQLGIWTNSADRQRFVKSLSNDQRVEGMEATLKLKSGEERQVMIWGELIELAGEPCMMVMAIDISEKKKAEAELKESQQFLSGIIDNSGSLIYVKDLAGKYLNVNKHWIETNGYSENEALGKTDFELFPPYIADKFAENDRNVIESGYIQEFSEELETNAGRRFIISIKFPLKDAEGKTIGICGMSTDITSIKQSENELKRSEEKYRSLINSSDAYISMQDLDGNYTYVNDIAAKPFGLTPEKLIGLNARELFPPDQVERIMADIQNIKSKNEGIVKEVYVDLQGNPAWFRTSIQPVRNEVGDVSAVLMYSTNITESKLAEQKVLLSEKKYKALFYESPIAYLIIKDGIFIECNKSAEELIGGSRSDIIGKTPNMLSPEFQSNGMKSEDYAKDLIGSAFETGMASFEWVHKRVDGTEFLASINLAMIEYEGGESLFVTWTDITQQRKAEEEVLKFKNITEKANYGVVITGLDGTMIYTNNHFARMHGYNANEITGKHFSTLHSPNQLVNVDKSIDLLKSKGEFSNLEIWRMRKDGTVFPSLMNAIVVFDDHQKPLFMSATAIDISSQKEYETEIKKQNEKLNAILNALPDKLFIHDSEGTFLEAYTTDPGGFIVPMEKFIGKNLRDIFPAEVADLNLKYLQECLNTKELLTHDFSTDYKGINSHFEVRVVPFLEDKVIRFVRDITEKKNREEEIRSQNQKLNAILNALPDRLFVHDSEGNYLEAYTTDPSGFIATMDNFIGKNIIDVLPKDVAETNLKYLQDCLEKKKILLHELSYDYKGTYSHFEVRVVPFMEDKVIRFVRDITERKEIEKQISKLNKAIEQSPVAIVITDPDANITYASRAFEAITGYSKDEVIGNNTRILKSGQNIKQLYTNLWKTIKSGEIWEGELINKKKDGTYYWEHLSITPLYETSDQITGYLAVKQDITEKKKNEQEILDLNTSLERKVEERTLELKRANEELVKAKEAADEANKAKSIFLANMSHEIRTPLNAIIGFSELLFNSSIDEKKRSQVESIRNSGRSLLNIINDILDLSKVEAGKIIIEPEPLNVFKIVSDVSSMFEQKAYEKKLDLTIESETDITTPLMLDETRLRQILFNIMGNAIKFTPQGGISVLIRHEEKDDDCVDLKISVKDTGIGIPEDQLKAIFEPFVQQQGQVQKNFGGTGLGLAISRRMAEAMGGEILVKSKMNEGSEFIVYLKNVSKADSHPEMKDNNLEVYSSIRFDGYTILVVDDITDNRKLLCDALELTGARLIEVENGAQAVSIAINEKPDIILMDIRMPVMDGLEACRILKDNPKTAMIPCIAVTASIKLGRSGKEIPENFEDSLMKPVAFDQLFEVLLRYLKQTEKSVQLDSHKLDSQSETEQEWPDDLQQFVRAQLVPLYNHVMRTQLVDEMEDFGKQLVSAGNKFNDDLLINIGNKLGEYADLFDVDKLTQTMHEFQFILNRKLNA